MNFFKVAVSAARCPMKSGRPSFASLTATVRGAAKRREAPMRPTSTCRPSSSRGRRGTTRLCASIFRRLAALPPRSAGVAAHRFLITRAAGERSSCLPVLSTRSLVSGRRRTSSGNRAPAGLVATTRSLVTLSTPTTGGPRRAAPRAAEAGGRGLRPRGLPESTRIAVASRAAAAWRPSANRR